ncbi:MULTISPECIES: HK97 family phage prohead protease [Pseudomonas]|uniref:HK97 family phage prohead protease n=1 Tax=Pseudomonas TaxID=286 RepID=UPI0010BF8A05|nr:MULTISPECIES: HK97 family phage prohead protease [Pseudomonas]MBF8722694.1 HK97 family phage prohead protease [Pseudomonas guariconensis]
MELERRFSAGAAVEGRQLIGLAAPFGAETSIGDFREVIAPGAFTRTLSDKPDILALVDHDTGKVLGRTRSGTLELRETSEGLEYRLTLPDTSTGNDLRTLAKRGDLGGVSFGFRVLRDSWAGDLRTLQEVELHEISIVQAHPAYPTTTVSLRSRVGDCPRLALARRYLEAIA